MSALTVVLVEEADQFGGWSIDGHFHRCIVLVGEHRLEQLLAQAAALTRLVHVEVENAGRPHLFRVAVRIEHVQALRADLQHADHAAAVKTMPQNTPHSACLMGVIIMYRHAAHASRCQNVRQ